VKYSVRALGPVRNANIDIRPLTVLVGENNTGKSWLAYGLFGLLRLMSSGPSRQDLMRANVSAPFAKNINAIASEMAARIERAKSATVRFQCSRRELLRDVRGPVTVKLGSKQLSDVIGAPVNRASVRLSLDSRELDEGPEYFFFSVSAKRDWLAYGASRRNPTKLALDPPISFRGEDLDKFSVYGLTLESSIHADTRLSWRARIQNLLTRFLMETFTDVEVFPAERTALAAMFEPLVKDGAHREMPLPVRDFLDRIASWASSASAAKNDGRTRVKRSASDREREQRWEQLAGGRIDFDTEPAVPQLRFRVKGGPELPLSAASSFAKSLAALSLRVASPVRANQPTVLVIDEPEMNAHPRAQLAIIELLAVLANRGHYVIVTTHSPYIIDHLNNLVTAYGLNSTNQTSAAKKFVLKDRQSFLSPTSVAAWEVGADGTLHNLARADGTISGASLGQTSSMIENLHADLVELGEG
jgi:predicted ATPase